MPKCSQDFPYGLQPGPASQPDHCQDKVALEISKLGQQIEQARMETELAKVESAKIKVRTDPTLAVIPSSHP